MAWRDSPVPGRATLADGAPLPAGAAAPATATSAAGSRTAHPRSRLRAWDLTGGIRGGAGRVCGVLALLGVAAVAVWLLGFTPGTTAGQPATSASPWTTHGPYPLITPTRAVAVRVGPSRGQARTGTVPPRATVTVRCRVAGQPVNGPYGRSDVWDYLTTPATGFAPDALIDTTRDDAIPTCAAIGFTP